MADWFLLGFAIAIIPLYIFGLTGNILVIRIVHKTREMHTTTNYLLANLAVSDAITLFTIPMMYSAYVEDFGRPLENFGKFSCKFAIIGTISMVSSASTLTFIAVERYHAILKPFSSNLRLNEENIKKAIVLIWTLSIVEGKQLLQELITRYIQHSYCAGVATFSQIVLLLDGFRFYWSSSRWLALENVRLQKITSMPWLD
ncbi:growth hormone secretagogue receptor type 1-like [Acropora palmata]|uniref:growth hormone secretagogue receptor type 1-like n=1 Tax=Acropora palmata TaxID=6131 RepID=UPI003DA01B31